MCSLMVVVGSDEFVDYQWLIHFGSGSSSLSLTS